MNRWLRSLASAVLFCPILPLTGQAQQFVTDDASIVDHRSCQLEGWFSDSAWWLLPSCQPVQRLEITAGVGSVPENGGRTAEYVVQGKYVFREVEPGSVGIGLVGGVGFGPIPQVLGEGLGGVFAYVPLSVAMSDGRLTLHGNIGWHNGRDGANGLIDPGDARVDRHSAVTLAARGDLILPIAAERFAVVGELFGEYGIRPEYQIGFRSVMFPDRLLVDLSWGGNLMAGAGGAGWALGFAWTPEISF